MKPWPTRSDISSAEARLAHSKLASRASFARLRSALRARLTNPFTLLVATGAGTLVGMWLARRFKTGSGRKAGPARAPSARTSIAGMVSTFLTRFGMQRLAGIWARRHTPDLVTK